VFTVAAIPPRSFMMESAEDLSFICTFTLLDVFLTLQNIQVRFEHLNDRLQLPYIHNNLKYIPLTYKNSPSLRNSRLLAVLSARMVRVHPVLLILSLSLSFGDVESSDARVW